MKKLVALGLLFSASASSNTFPTMNLNSFLYTSAISGYYSYPTDDANSVDTISGVRVGAGINPLLDVEAGYIDLGKADDPDDSDETLGIITRYVAAKPNIPLGLLKLYGRVGIHHYKTSSTDSGETQHDYHTDFLYGFGVDLATAPNFSVGLSYTVYQFDSQEVDGYEMNVTFHP